MARGKSIEVYALNISANPHPTGIYIELLTKAAGIAARIRGEQWAAITPPATSREEGVFEGRIILWTNIDLQGDWIDLNSGESLAESLKAEIRIPDQARPGRKVFSYVFKEKGHRLYYEGRNEHDERLGPRNAQRLFSEILSQELLGAETPDVNVTVVPRHGAVEEILQLPGLRQLYIRLVDPNDDDTDEDSHRGILEELRNMNAKQVEERIVKKAGVEKLRLSERVKKLAQVAAENGQVSGVGRQNGKTIDRSTIDRPRREVIPADQAGSSFLSRLLGSVGLF